MELMRSSGDTVQAELVLMSDWKARLPAVIAGRPV
jgi:hypothetical protein